MRTLSIIFLFALVMMVLSVCSNSESNENKFYYFSQTPPGDSAIVFAKDIISRENIHGRIVFSQDCKDILWTIVDRAARTAKIQAITYENEKWSNVYTPSFATKGMTSNTLFSKDGKKLFFRLRGNDGWQIKYSIKSDSGWSEPKSDGFLLNPTSSFTGSGKAYYTGYLAGAPWNRGTYHAEITDTGYANIELLDSTINSKYIDYTPYISPDEEFILFSSSRPSDEEDMYINISFRNPNGSWTEPKRIHDAIQYPGNARFPSISPDGKYLFFCSDDGNIYWVDIKVLDKLRPQPK
jgi:hypothetical protein